MVVLLRGKEGMRVDGTIPMGRGPFTLARFEHDVD